MGLAAYKHDSPQGFCFYYHPGEYFVQPTQAAYATQDSFTKYDARIAVVANDDRREVGLTGRNSGDESLMIGE